MAKEKTKHYAEASGKKTVKGKRKLRHIQVSHAENGGHIVEHSFDNSGMGSYQEPEQHVFAKGEGAKMLAHVGAAMGAETSEPEAKDEAAD